MRGGCIVLVSCKIRDGAFSGERVIRLMPAGGAGEYLGIAPVGYCQDADRVSLVHGRPGASEELDGFVEAYLFGCDDGVARVGLPDTEVLFVPVAQVCYRLVASGKAFERFEV